MNTTLSAAVNGLSDIHGSIFLEYLMDAANGDEFIVNAFLECSHNECACTKAGPLITFFGVE